MTSALTGRVVGAAGGLVADRFVGEPPDAAHPVVWFGRAMTRVEETTYADRRVAGVVHTLIGVGAAAGVGAIVERLLGRAPAAALATAVCVAGSMLDDEAAAVASLVRSGDVDGARQRLRSLVGRDTTELGESEISRAVIESVAENTVDAVTASWWWAGLGGAPAVVAHRASNTLDAMVGHRTERYIRFGWASARLDDVLAYVPARLTALTVAAVRPRRSMEIARAVRRDAGAHPSPNGGIVEA
ncbi:MAG: adenosylcobinamide-phosphate synthase CbiB, partial [Actinomycetota bacterium]